MYGVDHVILYLVNGLLQDCGFVVYFWMYFFIINNNRNISEWQVFELKRLSTEVHWKIMFHFQES